MKYKKFVYNIYLLVSECKVIKKFKKIEFEKKVGILWRILYGKVREGWWNSYGLFVSIIIVIIKVIIIRIERMMMMMVSCWLDNLYCLVMVLLIVFMLFWYCCVWNNVIDKIDILGIIGE